MLSAQSARDSDMDQALYDITMDWLEGPLDFSDLSADATVSRRFEVRQGSTNADGTRVVKVRPIDDLTESLINLTNGGEVTIAPMGVDAILASIAHRVRGNSGVSLRAKTIDLRKAYKNLPVSERAMSDSHLLIFEPGTNKPLVYRSKVLVFGARASVLGFCRTAVGLWAVGVRLLFLHWTQYFDDFFIVGGPGEDRHLDMAQRLLFQILGWETSVEKEGDFAELARVLGVEIDLASARIGIIMARNSTSRIAEITGQIDAILAAGRRTRGELKVLRGRLQFAEQQFFGRASAWMVKILSDAAEAATAGRVTPDLERALQFLKHRINNAGPREVNVTQGQTWFMFTDAFFDVTGGLGGMIYDHAGRLRSWYSSPVSAVQCQALNPAGKKTIISELEALAVLTGMRSMCGHWDSRGEDRLLVFIDNEASLGALIAGKSTSPITRAIVELAADWECSSCPGVWYERVASHSNPADAPSRFELAGMDPDRRVPVHLDSLIREVNDLVTCGPGVDEP